MLRIIVILGVMILGIGRVIVGLIAERDTLVDVSVYGRGGERDSVVFMYTLVEKCQHPFWHLK